MCSTVYCGESVPFQAIDIVRRISPEFYTEVPSATELPLVTDSFDVSFSIGLIEHFTREVASHNDLLRSFLHLNRCSLLYYFSVGKTR